MTFSLPSKSTKHKRFLEQIKVHDLYAENPGISNLNLPNTLPNDILVNQENLDNVINYFSDPINSSNLINNITYLPFSSFNLNVNDKDGFLFQSSDSDSDVDKVSINE